MGFMLIESHPGEYRVRSCFSRLSLIRWVQIAFSIVVLVLIQPGIYGYSGYPYILAASAFCMAGTFLLLLVIFLGVYPSVLTDFLFNLLACLMFIAAFVVAVYDTVQIFDGNWAHHKTHGRGWEPVGWTEEWKDRMAAVSAFCGANAILYAITTSYINRYGYL
jgi:hypothetical protein